MLCGDVKWETIVRLSKRSRRRPGEAKAGGKVEMGDPSASDFAKGREWTGQGK